MVIDFKKETNENLQNFLLEKLGFKGIQIFKGELDDNGLPTGVCEVFYDNTKVETIKFTLNSKNQFSGPAVVTYKENRTVNYLFYNDDYAKITYINGAKYNGKVKHFLRHGTGNLVVNGYKLEGKFVKDKKQGEFVLTFLDKISTKVTYLDDQLTGKLEKAIDKYTKLFAYYNNGKLVKCEYIDNESKLKYILSKPKKSDEMFYTITGNGQIFHEGKLVYKGDIVESLKHGFGEEFYEDGNCYVGMFDADFKHGKGIIYDKQGNIVLEGKWEHDRYIGEIKTMENQEKNSLTLVNAPIKKEVKEMFNVVNIKKAITEIEKNIVGQKKPLNLIFNNLLLSFLCEKEENKPITSILMTGPTGVGKTETAKQISDKIYGKQPFVVDFANFYDDHMLASLIGSPPGYVGFDQTPPLLQFIQKNQKEGGVILFEEIDKADSECLNIFMRILDEGEIISAKNVPYKVNNFIILATTNMSANYTRSLGFSDKEEDVQNTLVKVQTGMKREQLARFNLVTEFEDLTKEDRFILCKDAVEQTIKKLKKINGYKIKFDYNDEIIGKIVDKINPTFGVREIRKTTSREITQKLAEFIRKHNEKDLTVKINDLEDVQIIVNKNTQKTTTETTSNDNDLIK